MEFYQGTETKSVPIFIMKLLNTTYKIKPFFSPSILKTWIIEDNLIYQKIKHEDMWKIDGNIIYPDGLYDNDDVFIFTDSVLKPKTPRSTKGTYLLEKSEIRPIDSFFEKDTWIMKDGIFKPKNNNSIYNVWAYDIEIHPAIVVFTVLYLAREALRV